MSNFQNKIEKYDKYVSRLLKQEGHSEAVERATEFKIDLGNLTEEVEVQAAVFQYIASLRARAEKDLLKAKLEVKVTEANVRLEIVSEKEGGRKGPTVDDVKAMVQVHPDVITAHGELVRSTFVANLLEADMEAARMKAEMLKLLYRQIQTERTVMPREGN